MRGNWKTWVLMSLFVPAFFLLPLLGKKKPATPPTTPEPVCFLSGDIADSAAPKKRGIESAGNLIRLNLAANTLEECKIEVQAYCRTQIAPRPQLVPHLKAYFRNTRGEEVHFVLRESCTLSEIRRE